MSFPDGRAESDQAVFFESFNPGNFEIGVKMVDACGLPDDNPLRAYCDDAEDSAAAGDYDEGLRSLRSGLSRRRQIEIAIRARETGSVPVSRRRVS